MLDKEGHLVELADSPLAGNVRIFTDYDPEWEIDPNTIKLQDKIGEPSEGPPMPGRAVLRRGRPGGGKGGGC